MPKKIDEVALDLKIEGVEAAAKAFDLLAASIERATEALEKLNGAAHGGITINWVGELGEVRVSPPSVHVVPQ